MEAPKHVVEHGSNVKCILDDGDFSWSLLWPTGGLDSWFYLWETHSWTSFPWDCKQWGSVVAAEWGSDSLVLLAFSNTSKLWAVTLMAPPPLLDAQWIELSPKELIGCADRYCMLKLWSIQCPNLQKWSNCKIWGGIFSQYCRLSSSLCFRVCFFANHTECCSFPRGRNGFHGFCWRLWV